MTSASRPEGQHPPIAAPLGDVETERLELRRFRPDDLDGLAVLFAHREVWQFPYGRGFDREETRGFLEAQLHHWDACGFGLWLAVARETGGMLGYVGLSVPTFLPEILPSVEVGWRFDPAAWGHGYATEGARAALREAFTTLGLPEVCSLPQVDNPASVRVCERLGMRRERVVELPANERRGAVEAWVFERTEREWREA